MDGSEVTTIREALNLSAEALAERLGVHRSTIQRWERGLIPVPKPAQIALRSMKAGKVAA